MKKLLCLMVPCLCFLLASCADMKTAKLAYQSGDYEKTRRHLMALASRGFPQAQTRLGEMSMEGVGTPANKQAGIKLFNQALHENDTGAMVALGKAYRTGTGVPVDRLKARAYLDKALALNDPHAYYQLGLLEEDENNLSAAESNFNKALQAGYIKAWYQLGVLAEIKGNLPLASQ